MDNMTYARTPKAVHHQCMWIVRDIDRLYRLDAIRRHGRRDDELVFYEDDSCCVCFDAMEEASWKLSCIKKALLVVPEEYRVDLIDCIAEGASPPVFAHENTWKKWKRIFISELACNLKLI